VGEFDPYVRAWRERWERERHSDRQAAELALETARRLAAGLRERYGAVRVVLGGSLARGDFRVGSDIDLAVEGLEPDAIFAAGAELEREAAGLTVDLVPLESASPDYLRLLEREGIVLHDSRPR
jgi:predicted nucleotidyltransferase